MQINKTDFKVILNHMKSLSQLENNNLINQTRNGKTDYNDINQLINIYSSKKISKLMDKINNNFLTFGGKPRQNIKIKVAKAFAKLKTNIHANVKNKFNKIIQSKGKGDGEDDDDGEDDGDGDGDGEGEDNGRDRDQPIINETQRQELINCIEKLEDYIKSLQRQNKK